MSDKRTMLNVVQSIMHVHHALTVAKLSSGTFHALTTQLGCLQELELLAQRFCMDVQIRMSMT